MRQIIVVDYDPDWPRVFEQLRLSISHAVADIAIAIEHVGSTAVPGLAAKPIIDLDVIVASTEDVPTAIERLARLGYVHRGDLGIEGREAFQSAVSSPPHHLYVCPQGNLALRNHLAVRDVLRADPKAAREYGQLKKSLAARYPCDIDSYIEGKSHFVLELLRRSGLTAAELAKIDHANRAP